MPWLMKEVKKEVGTMIESRELLIGKTKNPNKNTLKEYFCNFSNFNP